MRLRVALDGMVCSLDSDSYRGTSPRVAFDGVICITATNGQIHLCPRVTPRRRLLPPAPPPNPPCQAQVPRVACPPHAPPPAWRMCHTWQAHRTLRPFAWRTCHVWHTRRTLRRAPGARATRGIHTARSACATRGMHFSARPEFCVLSAASPHPHSRAPATGRRVRAVPSWLGRFGQHALR